jgi:hypothetical protein
LARASACACRWSAVKNVVLFLWCIPCLIAGAADCYRTGRAFRIATGWIQPASDGCGRSLCSSVQCSYAVRAGIIRCTMAGPWQRMHRELDKTRGGEMAA